MTESPDQDVLETQARLAGLGVLAAGIAHELANPLGYLKSNTDFVLARLAQLIGGSQGDSKGGREVLEEIRGILQENVDGIRRMTAISSELRLVSRSTGETRPCDVEEVLERAFLLTHNLLKYKAEVVREFGHPPAVTADEGRLTQVFVNLLANAAQAIEDRGEVRVRTDSVDGMTIIEVIDDGCGIPEGNLPNLFQPFFTTKPPGVGTGLGLWMVRKLVEEFGGVIEACSEGGTGATFTVRLPRSGGDE